MRLSPFSFALAAVPVRARRPLFRQSARKFALVSAAVLALAACHSAASASGRATMRLTTASFANGLIPQAYTCDGQNRSPQLAWSKPPYGTRSLALTVTDPDAPSGTFTHWVLYNLPAATRTLPEDLDTSPQLPNGALQGRNDFRRTGYGGPCPPRGSTHRYVFTLYALDAPLALAPGSGRAAVEAAFVGHILARAQLIARYTR
jgi:Raf kinase inhibitor-like YbhB/YbcL family protein